MLQQQQTSLVGPLQILEHKHDRLVFRCSSQEPDHCGEEQETLGVSVSGFRIGQLREPPRQGWDQRNQIRFMLFDVGEETVLGGVGDVVVQGFGEELIRGGKVFFAVAEEDAGPSRQERHALASATKDVLPTPASPEIRRTSRT